jgi:polysaccharide export outer membrane protein
MPETFPSLIASRAITTMYSISHRRSRSLISRGATLLLLTAASCTALAQASGQPPIGGSSTFGGGGSAVLHTRPQGASGSAITSVPDDFSSATLAPGYLLDMQVYDMPEISGQLRVDNNGNITVPMAGSISVNGMSLSEAHDAIEAKLRDAQILKDPKINLDVAQYADSNVTVLGEVASPGRIPLLAPHSLSDVLAMVGGETITAGDTVEIRHSANGHMTTQVIPYARSKNTPAAEDIVVRPGDTVTVPRAGIVYVLGAVNRPGGYVMQEDGQLDVAQALALAYGTQMNAAIGGIHIVHKNSDGTVIEIPVEFRKITQGKASAPMLHAQDIVYVPVSKAKTVIASSLGIITSTSSALIYTSR